MQKSIMFSLNNYSVIPASLKSAFDSDLLIDELNVDAARLFHHYYLDTRGYAPPNPDPAQFEHLELLLPCTEIRVRGDGFGTGTAFRRNRSNELGQAFCRWFLYEHLGITYFAHLDSVLDRTPDPVLRGLTVKRVQSGDTPDYFCTNSASTAFLAEAKGRTKVISFTNAEFNTWRKQFERVVVEDVNGDKYSVKGHIVATRFATEKNRASVKSTLFAEDPSSPGEQELGEAPELGAMVIALHYADITAKIRQPLLTASLLSGIPVPEEIQFPATVWEFQIQPLEGKRFVGGYFPGGDGIPPIEYKDGKLALLSSNPLRLDVASGTFFGIDEKIFKGLCEMGRSGVQQASQLNQIPDIRSFYSGISLLRDGTVIGPVDFFNPIGLNAY